MRIGTVRQMIKIIVGGCINEEMDIYLSYRLMSDIFTQIQSQAADRFKIGVVYPLSELMALPAIPILTGHKIAADEIMKAGGFMGKKVEFLVRDDAGNPELTTRYCRELITREKVD